MERAGLSVGQLIIDGFFGLDHAIWCGVWRLSVFA